MEQHTLQYDFLLSIVIMLILYGMGAALFFGFYNPDIRALIKHLKKRFRSPKQG